MCLKMDALQTVLLGSPGEEVWMCQELSHHLQEGTSLKHEGRQRYTCNVHAEPHLGQNVEDHRSV